MTSSHNVRRTTTSGREETPCFCAADGPHAVGDEVVGPPGTETIQWGLRSPVTGVYVCRDEKHAHSMMRSTSVVLGPPETREIVWRRVTPWTAAVRSEGPT